MGNIILDKAGIVEDEWGNLGSSAAWDNYNDMQREYLEVEEEVHEC